MSNPNEYTVGWICAITTEYVAAQEFLDEEHEGPEFVSPHDNNHYTLGKVGKHNVVIAVLPDNEYGKSSAASVARNMMHSFPNIRFGLMVGIAGGAPGKHDIRLGDIVISCAGNGKGGVFGYDFGKAIQGQGFQETGFLNQPPQLLRATVSGLKARYERKGHQLSEAVDNILERNKRLRGKYKKPESSTDNLFKSEATHDLTCATTCSDDATNLVPRPERKEDEDNPTVHYGLIASADQLMKDALARDKLSEEKEVLCFEMEAAGLMNHFPCLVIRGICDYSDTHKNKEWQGYAAMVAAAYAKDLLREIAPNKVEAERRISDILSDFQEIAQEHCDIAKEQLQAQKDLAKEKLSEEQQRCHQLFRLTTSSDNATYEWYKDRVEDRVEGTCMWFLKHDHFQTWLNQESGPLLVSADPGCGKSVLAKYLIDHGLPRSSTICYFFFKDQDQNTVRQAICALLHQLFSLKPFLIKHAMPQFREDGQGLIYSTESLWEVLRNATRDSQAGPVIIVLDALDECAQSEFGDLVRNVESQFRSDQSGYGKLKYLLTCRPYDQILSKFRVLLDDFPNIHIPGENESEKIGQEVNLVIRRRINQLVMEKGLTTQVKNHLEKKLQEATHRTYLWIYLVFDYLQKRDFKRTPKGIESSIATLPTSVNEAYEKILNKTKKDPMVLKVLCIILAARRPLTLSEMNIAVNIDDKSRSIDDLDLEDDEVFKARLRSWCGLFVSIHHGSIYFIHQTARDFLLADLASPKAVSSGLHWHHFITTRDAHAVLAKLCVLYLYFFNQNVSLSSDSDGNPCSYAHSHPFLDYAAKAWGDHFHKAEFVDDDSVIPFAMGICDASSNSYSVWFGIYWQASGWQTTRLSDLMIASMYGHSVIVKLLLEKGAGVKAKDSTYGNTPLSWAAMNGHEAVAKLLIEQGATIEAKNKDGCTPLWWAANNGHEAAVKILIERGAKLEASNKGGYTPLSGAADNGYKAVARLLIEQGAKLEAKNNDGCTPLSGAACFGHQAMAEMLVEHGADIETKNKDGCTPLSRAANHGHEAVAKLLIKYGAQIETKDKDGSTPLSRAANHGHEAVVQLLVEQGAQLENRGINDNTPLLLAAIGGRDAVVKLLIEKGAMLQAKNVNGNTPLSVAALGGHKAVAELLIEKGAMLEVRNTNGDTPLSRAAQNGHEAVVRLLIERGAELEARNADGHTPLSVATNNSHEAIAELLINESARVDPSNKDGHTPLSGAAFFGYEAMAKLLIKHGANIESNNLDNCTPLSRAAQKGHLAVTRLLVEQGAKIETKNKDGCTPLWRAANHGHEAVVRLLIEQGATLEDKNMNGNTPLSVAALGGHKAVTQLLVDNGAKIEVRNSNGDTPLLRAAAYSHGAVVKLLIDSGAEIEARNIHGDTPLLQAAQNGHNAVAKLLIERGAKIKASNNDGHTLHSLALGHGHEAMARLQIEEFYQQEANNMDSHAPLFGAVQHGYEAMVMPSIERGAEIEVESNQGDMQLPQAANSSHETSAISFTGQGAELGTKNSQATRRSRGLQRIVKKLWRDY
ncbi:hypothetical protein H9Q70_012661 [Fusarium xylarioides]|nr:hypothetical protein H9Q70_012661 [Fusarium xylarioides]KAG5775217.1 hypothetical protein H9Q73_011106 [Fusarium xylarioides]